MSNHRLTALGNLTDIELPITTGDLTATGVQYSAEVSSTTANVDVAVLSKTVNPIILGNNQLIAIEFGLTMEVKAVSSATADIIWKWQARNSAGTWVDLHTAVTETNPGTTYLSRTRQGKFLVQANLNQAKIDVQLLMQCNEANESRAMVNASSYVRLIFL